MLLDYAAYYYGYSYSNNSGHPHGLHDHLFETQEGVCPFCQRPLKLAFHDDKHHWERVGNRKAYQCDGCGWWEVEGARFTIHDEANYSHQKVIYRAILRSFDERDVNLPIEVLRRELTKRKDVIYQIDPRKMEQLVLSVFSDFYCCEVFRCGRGGGDGGVDLIMILKDQPIAIQVKRRESDKAREGVSFVRQFVGALIIAGIPAAMFVTSAKQFTKGAHKIAGECVSHGITTRFDLIDGPRLLEMLNLVQHTRTERWREVLLNPFEGGWDMGAANARSLP